MIRLASLFALILVACAGGGATSADGSSGGQATGGAPSELGGRSTGGAPSELGGQSTGGAPSGLGGATGGRPVGAGGLPVTGGSPAFVDLRSSPQCPGRASGDPQVELIACSSPPPFACYFERSSGCLCDRVRNCRPSGAVVVDASCVSSCELVDPSCPDAPKTPTSADGGAGGAPGGVGGSDGGTASDAGARGGAASLPFWICYCEGDEGPNSLWCN